MRTRPLAPAAIAFVLCLASCFVGSADITMDVDPNPVERGTDMDLRLVILNDTGTSIDLPTLSAPLPTGIDQWRTEVRVNEGIWIGYPANGLIDLSALVDGAECMVEIHAAVETAAPADLSFAFDLVTPSGVVMSSAETVNVLPSVDAGPDLVCVEGTSVTLSGASAHDGEASLTSFFWDDGGLGGTFTHVTDLHPVYEPPVNADLVEVTLTVVDLAGGVSDDSLRIQINAAPIVDLGEDLRGVEGGEIDLPGFVSDPDGWIVSVEWSDHGAGGRFLPSAYVLDAVYVAPILAGCDDAQIELTLTVTDDWGTQTSDSLLLWVENLIAIPVVDAGFDITVFAGATVDLVAQIVEAEDPIVERRWEQIEGPTVDLDGDESLAATFSAPSVSEETELVFRFTAATICGASDTDELTVIVTPSGDETEDPGDGDDGDSDGGDGDNGDDGDGGDGGEDGDGGDGDNEPPTPPSGASGSLRISLELRDSMGFPIDLFTPLQVGQEVQLAISVTNDGPITLYNLRARINDGEDLSFVRRTLDPWETARMTVSLTLDASHVEDGLDLVVWVLSETASGDTVSASECITLPGRAPTTTLDLIVVEPEQEVAAGGTVVFSVELRNSGVIALEGLNLQDQDGHWFDLPDDRLGPGYSLHTEILFETDSQDPGEMIAVTLKASGFTASGTSVSATALLSIEVLGTDASAGAGGWFSGTSTTPKGGTQRIVFSEIAWAGTSASPDDEWIELVNLTSETIDLTGWAIVWTPTGSEEPARTIALCGTISGLPYASAAGGDSSRISFVREESTGLWKMINLAWWGVDAIDNKGHGFYLVERGSDETVAGIAADCTYDPDRSPWWALPDAGATLRLIDPQGEVVDAVEADGGWPCGGCGASMERIDLEAGGYAENWQTNPGILTHGHDRAGRSLTSTAGMPNSPSLDTLMSCAMAKVDFRKLSSTEALAVPCEGATRPAIRISAAASSLAAGAAASSLAAGAAGGGGQAGLSPAIHQRWDPENGLEIRFSSLPTGSYFVWVVDEDGPRLLPVAIVD